MNKKALHQLGYGLYVVGSRKDDRINGQTANAVIQVASEPVLITAGINKGNLTHEFITSSRLLTVSVLSQSAPLQLIGRFGFNSGRDMDKLKGTEYALTDEGVPYLTEHVVSYVRCEIVDTMDAATHTVFLGRATTADVIGDGVPMTYSYYHQLKRGTVRAEAVDKKGGVGVGKYRCKVCGYVYDPDNGDPDNGVEPGIAFADLPDDWVCPVCGAGKDEFEPM